MTINPEIITQKPEQIPAYEQKLADDILKIIQNRADNSETARKNSSNLYVYIAIDAISSEKKSALFMELKPGLFFAKDNSFSLKTEENILVDVLKRAIQMHVDIPREVKTCLVYLSLEERDQSVLWGSADKETGNDTVKFEAEEPLYSLDEVVMNDDERDAIMRAVTLVKEKELIFKRWNFSKVDKHTKSILCFHGAPGTGKTMAAHGVARFLGKKILVGSYAQIESEFVGVGAKNLKAFFECARVQDAVLFIDEADTFLSKRLPSSNESAKHYNSMSNELYQLIEGFDGCIIFASNHIKDFDPAVISRIIEPVEFKLPDQPTRKRILSNLWQEEFPVEGGKSEELLTLLSERTEGFSGRDIRKALLIANANAAYRMKVVGGMNDSDIVVPKDILLDSFAEVREAKDALDAAMGKNTTSDLLSSFIDKKQKETRYLQMAAHALLADRRIDSRERSLYDELSSITGVTVPLVEEELPAVEELCKGATSKEERSRLLDVVVRMSAYDLNIHDLEESLIVRAAELLGVGPEKKETLLRYAQSLRDLSQEWEDITGTMGMTDEDILASLQEEYTKGAAYYHLGEMYESGSSDFGGIQRDETKAKQYYAEAERCGFAKERGKRREEELIRKEDTYEER
ncbi:MAG: AAA family ATPase [Bacteroidales bacterium]|nr:AAA family ATPase [Bacteroidales bacterium]